MPDCCCQSGYVGSRLSHLNAIVCIKAERSLESFETLSSLSAEAETQSDQECVDNDDDDEGEQELKDHVRVLFNRPWQSLRCLEWIRFLGRAFLSHWHRGRFRSFVDSLLRANIW